MKYQIELTEHEVRAILSATSLSAAECPGELYRFFYSTYKRFAELTEEARSLAESQQRPVIEEALCKWCDQPIQYDCGKWKHSAIGNVWCRTSKAEPMPENADILSAETHPKEPIEESAENSPQETDVDCCRNRTDAEIFELLAKLEKHGGAIVSSDDCPEIETANARLYGRFAVNADGFGFVLRTADWLTNAHGAIRAASASDKG